jgi:hypothetical protein
MSQEPVPTPPDGAPPEPSSPGGVADQLRAILTVKLGNAPPPPKGAAPLLRPGGPVAAVVREKKKWATVQADPVPAQDNRKVRLENVDRVLRDCMKDARRVAVAEVSTCGLPADLGDVRWFLPSQETVRAWLADEVAALRT